MANPKPDTSSEDDLQSVVRPAPAPGQGGEETALAAGRTNWPDAPERFQVAPPTSAAGHRPPTLAVDPYAPVYVPGDPNSLVPGETDSAGREVNPPPAAMPETGDDYYYARPEPALDDIERDSHIGRAQSDQKIAEALQARRREVVTRDSTAGKGELSADRPFTRVQEGKGAKPYRQASTKQPVRRSVEAGPAN